MSEKSHWLDSKENVAKLSRAFLIACVALILVEPLVHMHPVFEIDKWPGFYGWYAFFACVVLVLVAKVMRILLMRAGNYYDDE